MSFAVLGWVGTEIYLTALPIPKQVISTQGAVLFSEGQVQRSQKAWLSAGGQRLGSVWGYSSWLKVEMRGNTYDAATGYVTLLPERAEAVKQVVAHYIALFGDTPSLNKLASNMR